MDDDVYDPCGTVRETCVSLLLKGITDSVPIDSIPNAEFDFEAILLSDQNRNEKNTVKKNKKKARADPSTSIEELDTQPTTSKAAKNRTKNKPVVRKSPLSDSSTLTDGDLDCGQTRNEPVQPVEQLLNKRACSPAPHKQPLDNPQRAASPLPPDEFLNNYSVSPTVAPRPLENSTPSNAVGTGNRSRRTRASARRSAVPVTAATTQPAVSRSTLYEEMVLAQIAADTAAAAASAYAAQDPEYHAGLSLTELAAQAQASAAVGRRQRSRRGRAAHFNESLAAANNLLMENFSMLEQIVNSPIRGRTRGRGARRGRASLTSSLALPNIPTVGLGHPIGVGGEESTQPAVNTRRSHGHQVIAERAARATNVEYVDLVSSPQPIINGMVIVDSDDEKPTSSNSATNTTYDDPEQSFDLENPEINVKIIWHGTAEVFQLRKFQKFAHIFNSLAEREHTDVKNVFLNLDDKIIAASDTPASIDYRITQFIHGRVMADITNVQGPPKPKKKNANEIILKVQSDKFKRPLKISLTKTDKLKILYIKCSEELNVPYDTFKLCFDGDHLEYDATPQSAELDGGECIDLYMT